MNSIPKIQITLEIPMYYTEDPGKLRTAIKNLIQEPEINLDAKQVPSMITVRAIGVDALRPLYLKLRSQRTLEAARMVLKGSRIENQVTFYLNKQAAFKGRIHFCEPEGESPLGPIMVTVESTDITWFIDWLTPHTMKGKPVNELEPILGENR